LEKGLDFIQKPFTMDGLSRKVRAVLDKELRTSDPGFFENFAGPDKPKD
jgi:DNA-binding response OmpR family regulator